jgi:SpoVK/Ycf46/Vps4 family AAA+-type ATPase
MSKNRVTFAKISNKSITDLLDELDEEDNNENVNYTIDMNDDEEETAENFKYWIKKQNNAFVASSEIKTVDSLRPGLYTIEYTQDWGWYLQKQKYNSDELFELPFDNLEKILEDTKTFWSKREQFKKYKMLQKRGILLYGAPGGGKSCAIQLIVKDLIENQNGILFSVNNTSQLERFASYYNSVFRQVQPETPTIVIFEDIDGLANAGPAYESMLLNLLDGIDNNDGILYIATTNYPEKLEDRILNRPSRFDRRYEFTTPDEKVRRVYFEKKIHPDDIEKINLDLWVKKTDTLSLAHLRDLVVSVLVLGNEFEDVIKIYEQYMEEKPSSTKNKRKAGF